MILTARLTPLLSGGLRRQSGSPPPSRPRLWQGRLGGEDDGVLLLCADGCDNWGAENDGARRNVSAPSGGPNDSGAGSREGGGLRRPRAVILELARESRGTKATTCGHSHIINNKMVRRSPSLSGLPSCCQDQRRQELTALG